MRASHSFARICSGDMPSWEATSQLPIPTWIAGSWLVSLERLLELDIEIPVEEHGHIRYVESRHSRFPWRGDPSRPKSRLA